MSEILDIQKLSSAETDKVYSALLRAKKKMKAVIKDSKNPFFKSNYADLNAHLDEIEPLLEEEGCIVSQPPFFDINTGQQISVTRIVHAESGQFIQASMKMLGEDMQKLGAGSTYGRRFNLGGIATMKAEDDDGNTAVGKKTTPAVAQMPRQSDGKIQDSVVTPPAPAKKFGGGFGKKTNTEGKN